MMRTPSRMAPGPIVTRSIGEESILTGPRLRFGLRCCALLLLVPASTAWGAQPTPVLTKVPFTYILDYGPDHICSPAYIQTITEAPPTLLHLGKDVPFTHNWGPIQALGGENQAYGKRKPYAPEDYIRRLSAAETGQRAADLTRLARDLHQAGVKWVTPYICSMTLGGHPERRAGFWEFFDHWDEYQAFGLGPRPASDPSQWLQLTPAGKPQFFYTFTGAFYPAYEPNLRYAACQNRPEWRTWTEKVVENIARCGVDGVFVDNDNVFEYKFVQCLRCQVRPMLLTRPGWQVPSAERKLLEMNLASAALGNAEAAAFGGGGGFLQRVDPGLMQVQKQYRSFFEQHPDLYQGLDSWAEVAVVVLPDLAWLDGGPQHQLEVRKVTASLLDGHALFDYLIADQLTADNLAKYAVVVLPRVSHLAGEQAAALTQYVRAGGVLVMTGAWPQFDECGQRPAQPPLADLVTAPSPAQPFVIRRVEKGTAVQVAALPADWLAQATGRTFSVLAGPPTAALAKVRVNAFRQPGSSRYVVHLVNYHVPLGVEAREPEAQRNLEVALRLPGIAAAPHVRCYDPQGQTADLPAEVHDGRVRCTLPELRIYKVMAIMGPPR